MLDRIDKNIVVVPPKVGRIAQGVLPIAPLPDAALAFGKDGSREIRSPFGKATRESRI